MSDLIKLKSTKFGFGWGSDSDPAGGAYSAPHASRGYSPRGTSLLVRKWRGKEGERDGMERSRRWMAPFSNS